MSVLCLFWNIWGAGAGVEGVWVGVQREVLERCRGSVRGCRGRARERRLMMMRGGFEEGQKRD